MYNCTQQHTLYVFVSARTRNNQTPAFGVWRYSLVFFLLLEYYSNENSNWILYATRAHRKRVNIPPARTHTSAEGENAPCTHSDITLTHAIYIYSLIHTRAHAAHVAAWIILKPCSSLGWCVWLVEYECRCTRVFCFVRLFAFRFVARMCGVCLARVCVCEMHCHAS